MTSQNKTWELSRKSETNKSSVGRSAKIREEKAMAGAVSVRSLTHGAAAAAAG